MSVTEKACDPEPREPHGLAEGREPGRRPYVTPRLEQLGDLRDLTLGGSPGQGDSTQPLLQRTPQG